MAVTSLGKPISTACRLRRNSLLGVVLSIVGATGSTTISYILPGDDNSNNKTARQWNWYWNARLCILFGETGVEFETHAGIWTVHSGLHYYSICPYSYISMILWCNNQEDKLRWNFIAWARACPYKHRCSFLMPLSSFSCHKPERTHSAGSIWRFCLDENSHESRSNMPIMNGSSASPTPSRSFNLRIECSKLPITFTIRAS